jgi:hypothetical protein
MDQMGKDYDEEMVIPAAVRGQSAACEDCGPPGDDTKEISK